MFDNHHFLVLLQIVEDFSETYFLPVCEQGQLPLTFQWKAAAALLEEFWESSRLGRVHKVGRLQETEKLVHAQLQTPKQACVPAAWNI